jgi:hypothetical protein
LQTDVPENQTVGLSEALSVVKKLTVPPMVTLIEQKLFSGTWDHTCGKWSK